MATRPDDATLCRGELCSLARCERCRSVLRGNRLAIKHALRAADLPPDLHHLRAELAEFEAGFLSDEADGDAISSFMR